MTTPNRHIPYVPEGTLDPAAGLNFALNFIDALLQTAVISMGLTEPPVSNSDGDLYVPAAPATGAWAGLDEHLVRYVAEGDFWQSFEPGTEVVLLINRADGNLYKWEEESSPQGWVLAAGIGDAPNDGERYARRNEAWESLATIAPPVVTETSDELEATENNSGNYTRFTHAAPTYVFDGGNPYVQNAEYHGRYAGSGSLLISGVNGMHINSPAHGSLVIPPGGTFTVKIVDAGEADLFGVTEVGSP